MREFDNFKGDDELINALEKEFERGEWESLEKEDREKLQRLLKKGAESFEKKKLISLRISQRDLKLLKRKSLETGVPYQTLISLLIRQYVDGKIKINL